MPLFSAKGPGQTIGSPVLACLWQCAGRGTFPWPPNTSSLICCPWITGLHSCSAARLVRGSLVHCTADESGFMLSLSCLHEHTESHGLSANPVAGMRGGDGGPHQDGPSGDPFLKDLLVS